MTLTHEQNTILDTLHFVEAHTNLSDTSCETFDALRDLVMGADAESERFNDTIAAGAKWLLGLKVNGSVPWYAVDDRLKVSCSVVMAIASVAERDGRIAYSNLGVIIRDLWDYMFGE